MSPTYRLERVEKTKVRPNPDQPRKFFPVEQKEPLKASLAEYGQLVPIITHPVGDELVIDDGECRWRCLCELPIPTVLTLIVDVPQSATDLLLSQLIVNCVRSDLNPIDKGRAYQRLQEQRKCTQKELAGFLQLSEATVSDALKLLKSPPEILARVQRGELSPSAALKLRHEDAETQQLLIQSGKISRRALQEKINRKRSDKTKVGRVSIHKPQGNLSVANPEGLNLDDYIELLEDSLKDALECRKKGYHLGTLQRMAADRQLALNKNSTK